MSYFRVVSKFVRRVVTILWSVPLFGDVGVPMLIILSQICPQMLYSLTKYLPKHINFVNNLYNNSQIEPTFWIDFHKEQKASDELLTV